MGMTSSFLNGAAFMAGLGAGLFGATETVLEGGHYVATGLRKTADGVDYVTDKAQAGCRAGKAHCEQRKMELNLQADAENDGQKEAVDNFFSKLEKTFVDAGADVQKHTAAAEEKTIDVEAEIVEERPKRAKTGVSGADPVLA